ncbi:hypothetical protein HDU76_003184 [Blyttiomyces sp. JEL0837]|nr:hypothetical protein HDU76_003184 [Blyttiomyces sp. JEL0837]
MARNGGKRKEIFVSYGRRLVPALFLAMLFVAIVLIQDGIAHYKEPQYIGDTRKSLINQSQAQAGFILFFIGTNGFMVSRVFEYYKVKTELRKKVAAHSFVFAVDHNFTVPAPVIKHDDATSGNSASEATLTADRRELAPRIRMNTDRSSYMRPPTPENRLSQHGTTPPPLPTAPIPDVIVNVPPTAPDVIAMVPMGTPESTERNGPLRMESIRRQHSNNTLSRVSAITEGAQTTGTRPENENFDDDFEYIRRLKHILPQYTRVLWTPSNFLQIIILITEFLLLASFPYRDLLRNADFQKSLQVDTSSGSSVVGGTRNILTTISSGLPNIDTLLLSNIQFAVAWWCSFLAFIVTACAVTLSKLLEVGVFDNHPRAKRVMLKILQGPWILNFLPLVNLAYLVILGAFVDPLGCISSSSDPLWPPSPSSDPEIAQQNTIYAQKLRQERCAPVINNPQLQAYYVLTIYKISDEPKPTEGIISFTTRSEVLNKNAGLILLLLYTLIPTEASATARGVLGIFVLSGMIFYQIVIVIYYVYIRKLERQTTAPREGIKYSHPLPSLPPGARIPQPPGDRPPSTDGSSLTDSDEKTGPAGTRGNAADGYGNEGGFMRAVDSMVDTALDQLKKLGESEVISSMSENVKAAGRKLQHQIVKAPMSSTGHPKAGHGVTSEAGYPRPTSYVEAADARFGTINSVGTFDTLQSSSSSARGSAMTDGGQGSSSDSNDDLIGRQKVKGPRSMGQSSVSINPTEGSGMTPPPKRASTTFAAPIYDPTAAANDQVPPRPLSGGSPYPMPSPLSSTPVTASTTPSAKIPEPPPAPLMDNVTLGGPFLSPKLPAKSVSRRSSKLPEQPAQTVTELPLPAIPVVDAGKMGLNRSESSENLGNSDSRTNSPRGGPRKVMGPRSLPKS